MQANGHHILVIEDEQPIRRFLKASLSNEGYRVSEAVAGEEGLRMASAQPPDLVILDLGLPDLDGQVVLKRLREWYTSPIIILSARDQEPQKITALDSGADDYVTKPFSPKALIARVKALLRRLDRAPSSGAELYQYGALTMTPARHEVTLEQQEIPLTAKEFGLLEHLLRHRGRVLTREVLLNAVWGYDYYGTTRTVDVHIRRLKQKLPLLEDAIVAVKSLGYKLKDSD